MTGAFYLVFESDLLTLSCDRCVLPGVWVWPCLVTGAFYLVFESDLLTLSCDRCVLPGVWVWPFDLVLWQVHFTWCLSLTFWPCLVTGAFYLVFESDLLTLSCDRCILPGIWVWLVDLVLWQVHFTWCLSTWTTTWWAFWSQASSSLTRSTSRPSWSSFWTDSTTATRKTSYIATSSAPTSSWTTSKCATSLWTTNKCAASSGTSNKCNILMNK